MNSKDKESAWEEEYLRKLEESISGKSGSSIYKMTPEEELRKKRQLERLRMQSPPRTAPLPPFQQPEKEPPRIPIEWALGESAPSPPAVEGKSVSLPIEHAINEDETAPGWSKTPSPAKEPQPPRAIPRQETPPPTKSPVLLYELGTVLHLEDGSLGIYKGPISGKEYHLVYHLRPDGKVEAEGIYLSAYRCEALGKVPHSVVQEMQRTMRWYRDSIISHLPSEEQKRLVPFLSPGRPKTEVIEPLKKKETLERGRRLKIGFGDRVWDAVYWGSDELGQIVAHNTHKNWTLMHMNLGRFGDSLEYGDLCSPEEIREINQMLSEHITFSD